MSDPPILGAINYADLGLAKGKARNLLIRRSSEPGQVPARPPVYYGDNLQRAGRPPTLEERRRASPRHRDRMRKDHTDRAYCRRRFPPDGGYRRNPTTREDANTLCSA